MLRPVARLAAAIVAALVLSMIPVLALSTTATADQPPGYGPSDPFDDALKPDDGPMEPMRNKAKIVRTKHGYRFTAAQQNTHLRLTLTNGRLRFRDTATRRWKSLPKVCTRKRVSPGVVATCRVPRNTSKSNPTLIEVHPRLGNDFVDGRGLPARFQMAVLGDAGRDVMFGGRGKDYFTGAMGRDRVSGGGGKDWIRGGSERDRLRGGAASDWIVGMSGRDKIVGGKGRDRLFQ